MKILWFSNIRLTGAQMNCSGTWIAGMNDLLKEYYPTIQLANVTLSTADKVTEEDVKQRHQWLLPYGTKASDIELFSLIINKYRPDIIQIWGTEFLWASIPFAEICPDVPVILDMQGFYSSVKDVLYGDMTFAEIIKCYGIKEILRPRSSFLGIACRLSDSISHEEEAIKAHRIISVQSNWVKDNVKILNPHAAIYETKIALRSGFYSAKKWNIDMMTPYTIFSTASMTEPTKGSYTLLKAFREIKRIFPQARLIMAGPMQTGIKKSGYMKLMEKFIRKNRLDDSVKFVGSLNTDNLINTYLSANVFVNPSYAESYSLVLAEATYLGVPSVASFSGAMGELGENGSVLYFSKYDYRSCAAKIMTIFDNKDVAINLSNIAQEFSEAKHKQESVAYTQYSIYKSVLGNQI